MQISDKASAARPSEYVATFGEGRLGLTLDYNESGKLCVLTADSPASEAGVVVTDLLVAMNGQALPYDTPSEVVEIIKNTPRPLQLTFNTAHSAQAIPIFEAGHPHLCNRPSASLQ